MQTVYIVNILLPFMYILYLKLSGLSKETQNKILVVLYSVHTVLLVGTRTVDTGTDTLAYFRFYHRAVTEGTTDNYFEPLFSLVGLVCAKLGFSFTCFNIVIASLTMFFFTKFIIKIKCNAFVSVYLYISFSLFYNMMNQVRQALAMMIVLYAITFLMEMEKKKFVVWVIIATLFHKSSLIVLILLFLWNIKINKKVLKRYFFIGVFAIVFSSVFFQMVSRISVYGRYFSQSWRYGAYDINAILNLLVRIAMLAFAFYFYHELVQKNENINGYYHMILICTIFQAMTVLNNAMGRITTVFYLAYLYIVPEIVDHTIIFKKAKPILYPALLLVLFLYYYVYMGSKSAGDLYQSVLF